MGTRGLVGFKVDGEIKMAYNHFDSYPTALGADVLNFVRLALDGRDAFAQRARDLVVVDENDSPTPEQVAELVEFTDLSVGNPTPQVSWYQALRHTQGNLELILKSGYIQSHNDENGLPQFGYDSLFCEWAYLVNFDANQVEVYRGFQKTPPTAGIYVGFDKLDDGYRPITRIDIIPFEVVAGMSLEDVEEWASRIPEDVS